MKKSKHIIIRFIQRFSKIFFHRSLYGFVLFLRFRRKFNYSINRKKLSNFYSKNLDKINVNEFKIASQNNEDGIIEHIFEKIPNNKIFVEIGFGYYEFNSLNLIKNLKLKKECYVLDVTQGCSGFPYAFITAINLIKNNWSGLLIEQNLDECLVLRKLLDFYYKKTEIKIINSSVNITNVNNLIIHNLKANHIDFFSIDIDGNDYWVLKNLDLKNISCVCLEYNHWLGPNEKKTIPYNENHNFIDNGYFGASLLAFTDLMNKKEFKLIAIESSGTNAFFVQNKFSNLFEVLDPIKSFKSTGRLYSEEQKVKIYKNLRSFNFIDV